MKDWIIFIFLLLVGACMFIAGIYYRNKDKKDPESVKIYSIVSVIGIIVAAGSVIFRIVS